MKKILLLGNGAREHVVAETLKRSPQETEIYVVGGALNPALRDLATDYLVEDPCDLEVVREYAEKIRPDFAIPGPEAPIAAGVVDMLLEIGVHSCAPLQTVARLESSKSFTRDLLAKYDIPGNPMFKIFYSEDGLEEIFDELGDDFVVKADGLKGGKGVKVSGDHLNGREEGLAYARECLADGDRVVVEEKLVGEEFSLMSFADGSHTVEMPSIQDHKRAYEGDTGPNTGGMGTYSDADHLLPFLVEKDVEDAREITSRVLVALKEETGVEFKGIMYGGFIVTSRGVKLIEYNARFGDPEAMNALPLLTSDFVAICEAQISGKLDEVEVEFEKKATVCKYVVPEGYPDNPCKGDKIEVGEVPEGVKAYYASVDEREDGLYLSGSRAIAFVGIADTLEEAEKLAQSAVGSVSGPVFYREDIGTAELIQKRIDHMKEVRG
ncbi:phosphoribosylamine--glycine ligase [Candidatus Peregrinibacteria bacterium]|jgi:phosphoribosylamine---glycine ligase|nr:phosphoribosylamine--glycine ligase [Candidatus Peregrinibacteria bacterium]MBT4055798.1 phosphoribosylamine--glycine ligase [Candidatus Peregrinibacteria bacterium]